MKVITSILILAAFSFADSLPAEEIDLDINGRIIQEYVSNYREKSRFGGNGEVKAVINEFADRLFPKISEFSVAHNLDPIPLGNMTEKFLVAKIILEKGAMHGISTINRYDDVVVTYCPETKTLSTSIPITFSNISFTYDYEFYLLGVGPKGDLLGEMENVKCLLELQFNMLTSTASIKQLKTTDSGHISAVFHGNGLTDAILNILSQFTTTILHPFLQGIIEGIVKMVANNIVTETNEFIYNISHGNYSQHDQLAKLALHYIN